MDGPVRTRGERGEERFLAFPEPRPHVRGINMYRLSQSQVGVTCPTDSQQTALRDDRPIELGKQPN